MKMNKKNPISSNPLPYPRTTPKSSGTSKPPLLDYEDKIDAGVDIIRALICALIFVFCILVVAFLTIYFPSEVLATPVLPKICVVSLSVENFTKSSESGKANWNVAFQVSYPDDRLKVEIDKINIFLTYKGAILLRAEGKAFKIEGYKSFSLGVDFPRTDGDGIEYYPVENALVNQMEKDRQSGVVSFNLLMEMRTNYDDGVHKESYARGTFEGLKVRFKTAATSSGKFIDGNCKPIQTVETKQSMVMKLSDPNKKQKP